MTQVTTDRFTTWGDRATRRGTGLQRLVAGWAALGITLSGATQLRIGGLPVGAAEFILAAWLAFVAFLLLRGVKFAAGRAFAVLGGYWLAELAFLGIGAVIAVHTRRIHLDDAIHDGMAFIYVAALSTMLALTLYGRSNHEYHRQFARLTFAFHALAGGLLLGAAMVIAKLGPIEPWYGGIRFRGWSENPNQMALAMAPMPFLGWWLMRRSTSRFGKAACLLGIGLCVVTGFMTRSDGMRVAWVASLGAICTLLFYRVTMRGRSRWLHVSHVIIPALVLVVGVFFGEEIVAYVSGVAEGVYSEGDQGEKRFTLWLHGLQAIEQSPLFGFGPGAYSGYHGPFEQREAHNSFIDWGMSTGAVGVAVYLSLLAWGVRCALRSGDTMPIAMLISIVAVSSFGYVLRQPDFWTIMVLVLMLSEHSIVMKTQQAGQTVPNHGGQAWRPTGRPRRAIERSGFR